MSIARAFFGCFCAVEGGALVFCIGLSLFDNGLIGSLEGVFIWVLGQIVIFPIAIVALPFGFLLRVLISKLFDNAHAKSVSQITGCLIGLLGYFALVLLTDASFENFVMFASLVLVSGLIAGRIWWHVERPNFVKELS